ncbi:uncharacterized protein LOC132612529 [Lycium barbarum]|uniref:uncharacterized protein LOC132612529 n=1 Tax=Lycium barbarum TaxID=112863 RepID=UPI00293E68A4|nr:uncharacterized protein LOC132612529 [Lycium barbarum]
MPLWVRFPNLLLNQWGPVPLSKIASRLGEPMFADECTKKQTYLSYVRVMVNVDITQDMPKEIEVWVENGQAFTQAVEFDWKPKFCGGEPRNRGIGLEDRVAQKQVITSVLPQGEWLALPTVYVMPLPKGATEASSSSASGMGSMSFGAMKKGVTDVIPLGDRGITGGTLGLPPEGLVETKIKEPKFTTCLNKVAKGWKYIHNYAHAINGRVWIIWKEADVGVTVVETHGQYIHCTIADRTTDFTCFLTIVYGSNSLEERKDLWAGMLRLGGAITTPWCICGDFNSSLDATDRQGGNPVSDAETMDFKNFVDALVLTDMKASGRLLAWTNGHVWSKIDRAMCNTAWVGQYGAITT